MRSGRHDIIAEFNDKQLYPIIEPMTAVIDKLVNFQIVESEAEARRASQSAQSKSLAMWFGLAGALAIVAAAMAVVVNGVLKPMARLTAAVSAIGEGELDASVPEQDRRGEIGSMARVVEGLRLGSKALREMEDARAAASEEELARSASLLTSIKKLGSRSPQPSSS